jgi:hypothetical protein
MENQETVVSSGQRTALITAQLEAIANLTVNTEKQWHEPSLSWKTESEIVEYEYNISLNEQYSNVYYILDSNNVVVNAIIATAVYIHNNPLPEGTYIRASKQSSTRRIHLGGIGYTYNSETDQFIPPKPYDSWILNEETCEWESPVPKPSTPDKIYVEQYNAYISPPPDQSWKFNEEKLEWEPPTT